MNSALDSLQKIGIHNLYEAILYPPKSYTNTFLIAHLDESRTNEGVIKIKILHKTHFSKVLKIKALMIDFDELLEIAIFNAKPFHNTIFVSNKEMYIFGRFEYNAIWRINQPKIITNINTIVMNFPTTKMQNANLNAIFRAIINIESLRKIGLNDEYIKSIFAIFHPEIFIDSKFCESNFDESNFVSSSRALDVDFFKRFAKEGFYGRYLRALKFVEVFYHIKCMREKKHEFPATHTLLGDYQSFVDSLPFTLTNGQKNAIDFLCAKLRSTKATRCVVMGDVGCGKTIVILACVMMAYPKKSLLLAPTTILAKQLYNESKKFLPSNVRVGLVMSGDEIPDCDFLIGTHSLLFKNLEGFALFMTDEQHRFGTNQRQKIEQSLSIEGKKPHAIQFSATPIPRTMALIESNLVDFCFIRDLPFEKNIDTTIITKDNFSALFRHITSEIAQNRQVAIIYPLVEKSDSMNYQSIEEGLPFWQRRFERVYFTHGRDKQKEEIIEDFAKNGDLLIATTLFEVGISLPNLSTIIIVGAERLGFATLHQLRGRVSRNGLKGYCFLYTHNPDSPRLRDFIKTTNGFEIAELDLKYRSSGDILRGIRQSGDEFKFFDMSEDEEILKEALKNLN